MITPITIGIATDQSPKKTERALGRQLTSGERISFAAKQGISGRQLKLGLAAVDPKPREFGRPGVSSTSRPGGVSAPSRVPSRARGSSRVRVISTRGGTPGRRIGLQVGETRTSIRQPRVSGTPTARARTEQRASRTVQVGQAARPERDVQLEATKTPIRAETFTPTISQRLQPSIKDTDKLKDPGILKGTLSALGQARQKAISGIERFFTGEQRARRVLAVEERVKEEKEVLATGDVSKITQFVVEDTRKAEEFALGLVPIFGKPFIEREKQKRVASELVVEKAQLRAERAGETRARQLEIEAQAELDRESKKQELAFTRQIRQSQQTEQILAQRRVEGEQMILASQLRSVSLQSGITQEELNKRTEQANKELLAFAEREQRVAQFKLGRESERGQEQAIGALTVRQQELTAGIEIEQSLFQEKLKKEFEKDTKVTSDVSDFNFFGLGKKAGQIIRPGFTKVGAKAVELGIQSGKVIRKPTKFAKDVSRELKGFELPGETTEERRARKLRVAGGAALSIIPFSLASTAFSAVGVAGEAVAGQLTLDKVKGSFKSAGKSLAFGLQTDPLVTGVQIGTVVAAPFVFKKLGSIRGTRFKAGRKTPKFESIEVFKGRRRARAGEGKSEFTLDAIVSAGGKRFRAIGKSTTLEPGLQGTPNILAPITDATVTLFKLPKGRRVGKPGTVGIEPILPSVPSTSRALIVPPAPRPSFATPKPVSTTRFVGIPPFIGARPLLFGRKLPRVVEGFGSTKIGVLTERIAGTKRISRREAGFSTEFIQKFTEPSTFLSRPPVTIQKFGRAEFGFTTDVRLGQRIRTTRPVKGSLAQFRADIGKTFAGTFTRGRPNIFTEINVLPVSRRLGLTRGQRTKRVLSAFGRDVIESQKFSEFLRPRRADPVFFSRGFEEVLKRRPVVSQKGILIRPQGVFIERAPITRRGIVQTGRIIEEAEVTIPGEVRLGETFFGTGISGTGLVPGAALTTARVRAARRPVKPFPFEILREPPTRRPAPLKPTQVIQISKTTPKAATTGQIVTSPQPGGAAELLALTRLAVQRTKTGTRARTRPAISTAFTSRALTRTRQVARTAAITQARTAARLGQTPFTRLGNVNVTATALSTAQITAQAVTTDVGLAQLQIQRQGFDFQVPTPIPPVTPGLFLVPPLFPTLVFPGGRRGKKSKGGKRRASFTPTLVAREFQITAAELGVTKKQLRKQTFTGFEIRPVLQL